MIFADQPGPRGRVSSVKIMEANPPYRNGAVTRRAAAQRRNRESDLTAPGRCGRPLQAVIASKAKQSRLGRKQPSPETDCFALLAMMMWTAPPERHQVPRRGRRSATQGEAVHEQV